MGAGCVQNFGEVACAVCALYVERSVRSARRKRDWAAVRSDWFWFHDFCGGVGRAQACSYVENRPCEIVDEGTSVAWTARASVDLISWGISFRRDADTNSDVAADRYGGERSLRRAATEFHSEENDRRHSPGNDLRRDLSRTGIIARRS